MILDVGAPAACGIPHNFILNGPRPRVPSPHAHPTTGPGHAPAISSLPMTSSSPPRHLRLRKPLCSESSCSPLSGQACGWVRSGTLRPAKGRRVCGSGSRIGTLSHSQVLDFLSRGAGRGQPVGPTSASSGGTASRPPDRLVTRLHHSMRVRPVRVMIASAIGAGLVPRHLRHRRGGHVAAMWSQFPA